jgi:hypothetical protein
VCPGGDSLRSSAHWIRFTFVETESRRVQTLKMNNPGSSAFKRETPISEQVELHRLLAPVPVPVLRNAATSPMRSTSGFKPHASPLVLCTIEKLGGHSLEKRGFYRLTCLLLYEACPQAFHRTITSAFFLSTSSKKSFSPS